MVSKVMVSKMTPARARTRAWSRLGRATLVGVSLMWAVAPLRAQAASAQLEEPAVLDLIGAAEASGPMSSWAVAMKDVPGTPSVSPFAAADQEARQNLISGAADVIVSGLPFTESELEAMEATGREVIAAPMQAVGASFLVSGPFPTGIDLCTVVVSEDDPELTDCVDPTDYVGPLRLSSKNVADAYLQTPDRVWLDPEMISQLTGGDANRGIVPVPLQVSPVTRSDRGMPNVVVQQYIARSQPSIWTAAFNARFPPLPQVDPAEHWVFPGAPERNGLSAAVGTVRMWLTASGSSTEAARGGAMTLSTTLEARAAIQAELDEPPVDSQGTPNVRTELYVAQLRNGAGEWLDPTPEAITTALQAGGGTPLYGLTESVPGAWPISWVNSMYVPSSGLTAVEANTVAAIIRWQSTVGREGAALLGDGQLPEALVEQALAAADRVVESNCAAADVDVIRTDDPSPYAPAGSLAELGALSWCEVPVEATTTTTTVPGGGTGLNPIATAAAGLTSGGGSGSYSPSGSTSRSNLSPIGAAAAGAGGAESAGGSGTTAESAELAAAEVRYSMPLDLPGPDPYDFDRLTTLALGGLMYLFGRWLLRRWGVVA